MKRMPRHGTALRRRISTPRFRSAATPFGITPIDELATARIKGRRRYGPLHVPGNGESAQRVRRDPLAEGQLHHHGKAEEHRQVDGDHAEELHRARSRRTWKTISS